MGRPYSNRTDVPITKGILDTQRDTKDASAMQESSHL